VTGVARLSYFEAARFDRARLEALILELGEPGAERLIGRALEDLALRLNRIERGARLGDVDAVLAQSQALVRLADDVGMSDLARVAGDVVALSRGGDAAALAATIARLIRLGESALMSAWNLEDQSV
jgi:hypothetical protein